MTRQAAVLLTLLMLASAGSKAGSMQLSGIGGTYAVPVTNMKEMRFRTTLRQQYDFSCGSAAVATLLGFQYGYRVSEQAVFQEMYARGDQAKIRREGFSMLDIKRYLAAHGFAADGFVQPLEKLTQARLPAIVLINDKGFHHFVVIKGVREGRVLIGDPVTGIRTVTRTDFERMWVNRLLFVIHNRQEQALFNTAEDWRAAPHAPVSASVRPEGLLDAALPKLGISDF